MIYIIAVGTKQLDWVTSAFEEYAQRLSGDWAAQLKEIKAEPRAEGKTAKAMMALEAQRIEAAIPKGAARVALDEKGKALTTEEFASWIEKTRLQSRDIAFVIGGPDGLDEDFKKSCSALIRLSSMTLPHGLARVLLAEQIYRAWSLRNNHPYHRV